MRKILFLFCTILFVNTTFGQLGNVTDYSGSGQGNADGILASARYNSPAGIAIAPNGDMYVADYANHKIKKITVATGMVTTFAGSGIAGFANGTGTAAQFNNPIDVAIDSNGNLYVSDHMNLRIRKVSPAGVVTTIAGNGSGSGMIDGNGVNASLSATGGIVVDGSGSVYFCDGVLGPGKIRKIDTSNNVTTIAGGGAGILDGPALNTLIKKPYALELDASGNLYYGDVDDHRIRKINLNTNTVTTVAGNGTAGGANGVGTAATLNGPIAMTLVGNTMYFCDRFSHNIRSLDLISNRVSFIAGKGVVGSSNGIGSAAAFNAPTGIAANTAGELFVGDLFNNKIRKIVIEINLGTSCEAATQLLSNSGTVNIGTISGAIPSNGVCYTYAQANPNANWWSFTPTQNGLLDITTVTAQNASTVDTRLSVFTGDCSALTCFTGNDNISGTDLRSNLEDLILTAGTTYYLVFDDKTSDNAAVNFYYEFTPQTCFRPNGVSSVSGTNTETTCEIDWGTPSLGDTTPDSYTIQIGPREYVVDGPDAIQTFSGLTGNIATLTGLAPNTVYDLYIKTVCSPTDAAVWYGPFRIMTEFTAVNPTYAENFDSDASFLFVGWSRSGGTSNSLWRTYTSGPNVFTQSGQYSVYSPIEPALNTPANAFAYTRKMNLTAGQNYKVSYYPRVYIGSGVTLNGNMDVLLTPNTDYTNTATHVQIASKNVVGQTSFSTMYEDNFTVPSSGVYRVGFKNGLARTAGSSISYLMLDTVVISTLLSVDDFNKSGLSMYPNPVLDHVSITNNQGLHIGAYNIVDMNGRTLMSKNYDTNSSTIDLTQLTKGIYFIQLETEKGTLSKKS